MMRRTDKNRDGGRRRRKDSGVVLLDVLFAVFILGMAALPLVITRSNSIVRAGATARLRIARMLAGQKMEEVLVEEVTSEPDTSFSMSGSFEEEGYPDFTYEIDIEDVAIHDDQDLQEDPDLREWYVRRVTVTVTYPGEDKKEETFNLTTILPEIVDEEE